MKSELGDCRLDHAHARDAFWSGREPQDHGCLARSRVGFGVPLNSSRLLGRSELAQAEIQKLFAFSQPESGQLRAGLFSDLDAAPRSFASLAWHLATQEHPKLGVYVKGLYLMPCATKKDVMSNPTTSCIANMCC